MLRAWTRVDERLGESGWYPGVILCEISAKLVRNFREAGRLWLYGEAPAGPGEVGGSLCVRNGGRDVGV